MLLRTGTALGIAALLLASLAAHAADATTTFLQTHYYLLSLGRVSTDIESIRRSAQSSGFSVLTYDGGTVQAFRADESVAIAESVLADERLLVVDDGRFLLRDGCERFAFSVRPSETGYELVIDPRQDLPISDTLGSVLVSLQSMGVVGNEASLGVRPYAKDDPKGPAPPAGARLDSTLFGLRVALDWFEHAAISRLTLVGLRVEVVAEIVASASLPAGFAAYAIEHGDRLVKLVLPIEQLLALAQSTEIAYVRPPYRPSVP